MFPIREIRFRTSPYVELKQLGDLDERQRKPFLELEHNPEFYGLLVPKPPLMINLKSVERQTAELFQRLLTPACVDDSDANDVIDLVLDGIFEIECDGTFVSGADALPILDPQCGEPPITQLSKDALLHAEDLEILDAPALTLALYMYNCIPLSPFWKTRFAGRDAILAHLGADGGALRTLLDREFSGGTADAHWFHWTSRSSSRPHDPNAATYKLYVSPRPERIRDAFAVVARVLSEFPGTAFKIGDSAAGLLRPDKLVAYFISREQLEEAAAVLQRELAGCDAHGVPFTAAIDDTGLLSWGVDPPDTDRALSWLSRDSWRVWVAQRLGAALSVAKIARSANAVEPWRFAVERARRHGIDVETWTPSAMLWSRS